MKKMISMLALMLTASFAVGCAVEAGEETDLQDVDAEETAVAEDAVATEARGGEAERAVCPPVGTCQRASQLCIQPPSSWCTILNTCIDLNCDM
ncbi:hypothetical protein [Chondromyces crocatus]|uniref:Dickkopf N-terminal cysteine-rich domain-containing protein n=1 Tax=Chondromyces crocatus TaxID=52 RepID=A0A0K1EFN6_CHOCO|nr:hypothetical protein [Chondromyces crocatus]AKT39507.1 uncharacterized protein CMC5_036540 [Chondromyces crocatus]